MNANISLRYLQRVNSSQINRLECDWPAGTGTITVFFCLVCPVPRQEWQGVEMTVPLPPQRRHVERITNGPVFTVSYSGENLCLITHLEKKRDRNEMIVGALTMPEPLQLWQCCTLVPGSWPLPSQRWQAVSMLTDISLLTPFAAWVNVSSIMYYEREAKQTNKTCKKRTFWLIK